MTETQGQGPETWRSGLETKDLWSWFRFFITHCLDIYCMNDFLSNGNIHYKLILILILSFWNRNSVSFIRYDVSFDSRNSIVDFNLQKSNHLEVFCQKGFLWHKCFSVNFAKFLAPPVAPSYFKQTNLQVMKWDW